MRTRNTYELNEDVDAGFQEAVRNQQPSLAMQYLVSIIERQNATIARLEAQLNTPAPVVVTPAPKEGKQQKKTEPE